MIRRGSEERRYTSTDINVLEDNGGVIGGEQAEIMNSNDPLLVRSGEHDRVLDMDLVLGVGLGLHIVHLRVLVGRVQEDGVCGLAAHIAHCKGVLVVLRRTMDARSVDGSD